jgi:predicted nucleic acid-binding protein
MLVVADSSPLNFLIRIGHLGALAPLFEQVFIPGEVLRELSRHETPQMVRDVIANPPAWLHIQDPTTFLDIPGVHAGEREAINLAVELRADLILIDDRAGRRVASSRGLSVIGTIGVLERAAIHGMLNLRDAFQLLRDEPDFRVDPQLMQDRLDWFYKNHPSG